MKNQNESIFEDWQTWGYGLTLEEAVDAYRLSRETGIQYPEVLFSMSKLKIEGLQGIIWGLCRKATAGRPRTLSAMRLKYEVDQHIALARRFSRACE